MKKAIFCATLAVVLLATMSAVAGPPGRGMLWLNGELVRTLVPPDHVPAGTGTDPLYAISTQSYNVAGVGPGQPGYHGGRWAIYVVTWNAGYAPHEMHSDEDVMAAQQAGEITVTRNPDGDNRCPLNPGHGQGHQ